MILARLARRARLHAAPSPSLRAPMTACPMMAC
jgi:hypothetical protein